MAKEILFGNLCLGNAFWQFWSKNRQILVISLLKPKIRSGEGENLAIFLQKMSTHGTFVTNFSLAGHHFHKNLSS